MKQPQLLKDLKWKITMENEDESTLDKIMDLLLNKKESFTCTGAPGCGKTFLIREVYTQLVEQGYNVTCLAPTHCAAALLPEGKTLHYFCQRFASTGSYYGICLLDEITFQSSLRNFL